MVNGTRNFSSALFSGVLIEQTSFSKYINNRPPFGAKIRTVICPRTLDVPRRGQFCESEVRAKLWASRNR